VRKIHPLGHKSSIKLLQSKGKATVLSTAKIIVFSDNKSIFSLNPRLHLAFATSKKRFPKAVDRNKIKRRFRAALQQKLRDTCLKDKNILMLIIPHQNSIKANFQLLKQEISTYLEKIL
jgi:ribonuclease P protein component